MLHPVEHLIRLSWTTSEPQVLLEVKDQDTPSWSQALDLSEMEIHPSSLEWLRYTNDEFVTLPQKRSIFSGPRRNACAPGSNLRGAADTWKRPAAHRWLPSHSVAVPYFGAPPHPASQLRMHGRGR